MKGYLPLAAVIVAAAGCGSGAYTPAAVSRAFAGGAPPLVRVRDLPPGSSIPADPRCSDAWLAPLRPVLETFLGFECELHLVASYATSDESVIVLVVEEPSAFNGARRLAVQERVPLRVLGDRNVIVFATTATGIRRATRATRCLRARGRDC